MDLFMPALVFLIAGMALLVWSKQVTTAAYVDQRVPLFRTATRRPRKAYWLQVIGMMLIVVATVLLTNVVGLTGALVPFAALLPWLLVGALHNRRVFRTAERAGAAESPYPRPDAHQF